MSRGRSAWAQQYALRDATRDGSIAPITELRAAAPKLPLATRKQMAIDARILDLRRALAHLRSGAFLGLSMPESVALLYA